MCVSVHTLNQSAESDEIVLLTITTSDVQNRDDAMDLTFIPLQRRISDTCGDIHSSFCEISSFFLPELVSLNEFFE